MKPSSGLRFSLFKSKRKKQPKAPQQQQQNPIQEPYNGIPTKAKQLQPRLPEQTEQNEEGDEDGIELAGELSTDDEIDDVAGEEAASNSGYGTPEGASAATAAGAGNSDESYMYSFGSMGLEIDDDYVSGFLGTFFQVILGSSQEFMHYHLPFLNAAYFFKFKPVLFFLCVSIFLSTQKHVLFPLNSNRCRAVVALIN